MQCVPSCESLVETYVAQLRARRWGCAVAESCTGGMLGAALTALPGVSDVFHGGVIAYQNEIKQSVLGVPEGVIARYGAVSEQVAEALCYGVAQVCAAECAIAITGIAGPDGGTREKPVGTVCIGVLLPGMYRGSVKRFNGSRQDIRMQSVQAALHECCLLLDDVPAADTA